MNVPKRPEMRIEISPDGENGWHDVTLPYEPDNPFSVVPYEVLKSAGILPQSLNEVRIVGRIEDRNIGTAFFRHAGRISRSTVVFPHSDDPCAWGWHAVYYLGWEIDPATGELRKVARIWEGEETAEGTRATGGEFESGLL